MSQKRMRTMSFDPYYVGSQASQIGYAVPVVARAGAKRKSMKKTSKKDKQLATIAYVKKLVDSRIEDKAQHFDDVINFGSYFLDLDLNAVPIGPSSTSYLVNQGPGQGQRIGNVIRVKKVILKYYLFPLPQSETNSPVQPQIVRIWVGNIRSDLSVKPDSTYIAKLYQSGNSAVPPTNTVDDMLAPINKDLFVEKASRIHKVGHAIGDPSSDAYVQVNQFFSNNDSVMGTFGTIDCTKFFRTKLHFDDATNTPDSNVFMWMEAVNCDNSQSLTGPTVKMVYNIEFVYEDA